MRDLAKEAKEEQEKLYRSLGDALRRVRLAEKSDHWNYTREFGLGQLTAARMILMAIVGDLKPLT